MEAKGLSFLKLMADVLGRRHAEDGKKKHLVDSLMEFLIRPTKVKRGVNLAEKAEALKEQRLKAKKKKGTSSPRKQKKRVRP